MLTKALLFTLALGCWAQDSQSAKDGSIPIPLVCQDSEGKAVKCASSGSVTLPAKSQEPTVQALQAELTRLQEENAKLNKLLAAWQQQTLQCWSQTINTQALAPPQPAPAKEKQP